MTSLSPSPPSPPSQGPPLTSNEARRVEQSKSHLAAVTEEGEDECVKGSFECVNFCADAENEGDGGREDAGEQGSPFFLLLELILTNGDIFLGKE